MYLDSKHVTSGAAADKQVRLVYFASQPATGSRGGRSPAPESALHSAIDAVMAGDGAPEAPCSLLTSCIDARRGA